MLLAALLIQRYSSEQIIQTTPDEPAIGSAFFLGDGSILVHRTARGHGGSAAAHPYIWSKGKLIPLLSPTAEFAHVKGATAKALYGDVILPKGRFPAAWLVDPKLGWAKTSLNVFEAEGRAIFEIRPDRTIVLDNGHSLQETKAVTPDLPARENFDLISLLGKGISWGNRYAATGIGLERLGSEAGFYETGVWMPFAGKDTSLVAVSPNGQAIGNADHHPVRWVNRQVFPLESHGNPGWPTAQNSRGQIVGAILFKNSAQATLWMDGASFDLFDAIAGVELTDAVAIDESGAILAQGAKPGEKQESLYLLRRRAG